MKISKPFHDFFKIDRDGTVSKLFIHSSHVLNEAEQILLEYLDQPTSETATKCKYLFLFLV